MSRFLSKLSLYLVLPLILQNTACANPTTSAKASLLWDEYEQTPDSHPNIPNCSYSGYQYGERSIPRIVGPIYNVTTFGARGDGQSDDTAAIRAAIAAVGSDGGVVWFPDGRYAVRGVLFVHTDRTVLRGQSQTGTEIIFTQPLDRGYGTFFYTAASGERATRWTYSGGLIWFGPKSRGNTYRPHAEPDSPIQNDEFAERWLTTGNEISVTTSARRGDSTIILERDSAAGLKPGDFVLLRQTDPGDYSLVKHLAGGGAWAENYDWQHGKQGAAWPRPSPLQWVVEIAAIKDPSEGQSLTRVLTLRQPLRFDIRSDWTPVVQRLGSLLRESGIEDMTLRFNRPYEWSISMHHREEGWNAPYFNNAVHCWLRDVTMIDVDNGPNLSCAKLITLSGFTIKASSARTLAHHHGTLTRNGSHDNLITDFRIESRPWHGLNVESFSSGNVWTRGTLEHGVFDSHRKMPYDGIRTDITMIANDGRHGGGGGPLMGARFVNWNIRTPSGENYIVGWANATPSGAIVGLQGSTPTWKAQANRTPSGESSSGCRIESPGELPEPSNLYQAQLQLRLKKQQPSPR
ncbi:hypothetical protein Ga0100231_000780 [Opitutaceae bacterium TAV4]|nr:hypothetical protein Ga0100230_011965 [Opitutaceae bacterium TAV3]RRK01383.1 hypothetical protein Ga0100231_000780 [Opitutaceae bacterium TAV4]